MKNIHQIKASNAPAAASAPIRPRIRNAASRNRNSGESTMQLTSHVRTVLCSNPLEKMCGHLVCWSLLEDLKESNGQRSGGPVQEEVSLPRLPISFSTCREYIESWEPLLVEEIKANILSNVPMNSRRPKKGQATVSNLGSSSPTSQLITLQVDFGESEAKSSTEGDFRRGGDLPTVMDLILLTVSPVPLPITSSSVDAILKGSGGSGGTEALKPAAVSAQESAAKGHYLLAMITSNTRPDGSRGMQIKASKERWDRLHMKLAAARHTQQASVSAAAQKSVAGGKATAGAGGLQLQGAAGQRRGVYASGGDTKTPTFAVGKPAKAASAGTIPRRQLSDSDNGSDTAGDSILLDKSGTLKMHYVVLDSMTTNWREFMALHDVGANIPLLPDLLASAPRMLEMSSTPPCSPADCPPALGVDPMRGNKAAGSSWCPGASNLSKTGTGSSTGNGTDSMATGDLAMAAAEARRDKVDKADTGTAAPDIMVDEIGGDGNFTPPPPPSPPPSPPYYPSGDAAEDAPVAGDVIAIDDENEPPPPPPSPPHDDDDDPKIQCQSVALVKPDDMQEEVWSPLSPQQKRERKAQEAAREKLAQERENQEAVAQERLIEAEWGLWQKLGITQTFLKVLLHQYNPSQLEGIRKSILNSGFTLIQGPPGTGKTTTVLGILNAIHIREYNRYYKNAVDILLSAEGVACRTTKDITPWLHLVSKVAKTKPRILVVAPSNVAVDNIIQRIMEKGFYDGNGGKYNPNILRLGVGKGVKAKAVSLEETLEQEQAMFRNETARNSALASVEGQIHAVIHQIYAVQSYLMNLTLAFKNHPLPDGWELRVASDTGVPYWVDHVNRASSPMPPPPPPPLAPGVVPKLSHYVVDTLPEYKIHVHTITQLLDKLDKLNLIRTRQRARINIAEFGGFAAARHAVESSVIEEAHIVFTTVNSAGHPSMESTEFCVTVVDEAAQCSEPSVLIPLRRGCRQCIMVGDPKQLSGTIFSDKAKKAGYDRSLFERLVQCGSNCILLNTQYRMNPAISGFASRMFYGSRLRDGRNVRVPDFGPKFISAHSVFDDEIGVEEVNFANAAAEAARAASAAASSTSLKRQRSHDDVKLKPMMFFDLVSSKDYSGASATGSQSLSNPEEAKMCVNILQTLAAEAAKYGCHLGSVGIITPYSDQLIEIRRRLSAAGLLQIAGSSGKNNADPYYQQQSQSQRQPQEDELDVEVNTVDGFQGREKDIIIISCVRANDEGLIGFLSDARRMNVALTRARFGLYVVGCAETLWGNKHWRKLITYAEDLDSLVSVEHADVSIMPLIEAHEERIASGRAAAGAGAALEGEQHDHEQEGQQERGKKAVSEDYSNPYASVNLDFAPVAKRARTAAGKAATTSKAGSNSVAVAVAVAPPPPPQQRMVLREDLEEGEEVEVDTLVI